jgi:hypothetical protein
VPTHFDEPFWIGDRYFSPDDIVLIREILRRFHRLSREEMVARLCENLAWTAPNGKLRTAACRELLADIEAAQWMAVSGAWVLGAQPNGKEFRFSRWR